MALLLYIPCMAQADVVNLRYNGLQYSCDDVPDTGALIADNKNGYAALKVQLDLFRDMITKDGFHDIVVTSKEADTGNHPLIARLQQLKIMPFGATCTKTTLVQYIKLGQQLFDLEVDGIPGKATLSAFNTPLATRVKELENAVKALEWLSCSMKAGSVVVVNLPSASLKLFEDSKVSLYSNIICGKPSSPTSTLCAKISEVILYPYWNVPNRIATRELLPKIKRSRSYLDQNNLQVVSKSGKIIDPHHINWQALSAGNFPYQLRQSTGCDNSLGIVKLNFYNPFTIYMHDTPAKSLFGRRKRFFSHGCMRVEQAVELARHMLTDPQPLDEMVEKGCVDYQSPVTISVQKNASVFVIYSTAWTDAAGNVHFYGDVYNRLPEVP